MQALVHFSVGVALCLLIRVFLDLPIRREFLLVFASGFWAMVPDGHRLFREFGIDGIATAWKTFHRSSFADLFWFHRFIDTHETGRKNLEAGVALLFLIVTIFGYYRYSDWTEA